MINQFNSFLGRFLNNRKNGDSGQDLEQMPADFFFKACEEEMMEILIKILLGILFAIACVIGLIAFIKSCLALMKLVK